MVGTILNTAAIVAGSLLGMVVKSRFPEKITHIVFQGIGLFTLVLGISMALTSENLLFVLISVVAGAVIGEWIDIDRYLRRFSDRLQRGRKGKKVSEESLNKRFTEGFITATMLFCIGSMSILGAVEDGLGETPNILFTKSIMDGISSFVLGAAFGAAILLSAAPVLLYQGVITIFAAFFARYMSEVMIADLTGVGGILLIGLAINILKIKDIRVTNMLPALVIILILSGIWG